MSSKYAVILASILSSVAASMGLDLYLHRPDGGGTVADSFRAKRFELIDDGGAVRTSIELLHIHSHEQPQIVLRDEAGRAAAVLTLNERGEATLFFNSERKEGKVGVGYLQMGDVVGEKDDGVQGWGMRVLGTDGKSTGFGLLDSGRPIP